jgi:hypothetical protein
MEDSLSVMTRRKPRRMAVLRAMNIAAERARGKTFAKAGLVVQPRGPATPFHLVIDASSRLPLPLRENTPEVSMRNRTRRRLGFVFMVLAVVFAALNLERTANLAMTGLPVVFLVVGAVLLRNSRSSTDPSESRRSSSR